MSRSEVAQLRQRIELELEAMRSGLSGFAAGTTRHAFIHARMEHIGTCQDLLADLLGEAAAHHVVCTLYMQTMERDVPLETTL
jgi:hypothetical protein